LHDPLPGRDQPVEGNRINTSVIRRHVTDCRKKWDFRCGIKETTATKQSGHGVDHYFGIGMAAATRHFVPVLRGSGHG